MTRAAARLALLAAGAAALPGAAAARGSHEGGPHPTDVETQVMLRSDSVAPARLTVLTGERVSWRNGSFRTHTVTSRSGLFDSGRIAPGRGFSHTFETAGTYEYFCRLHPSVNGVVSVGAILLRGPDRAVLRGEEIHLSGRTLSGPKEVAIEEDAGSGFRHVATVPVAEDGAFSARLRAERSASYRAAVGETVSEPLSIPVSTERQLVLSAPARGGRRILRVRAVPSQPGAIAVLQMNLRERFGWWPVARRRLDRRSSARFVVPDHLSGPARVVLTRSDGATVVATSRVLRVPR